MKSKFGAISLLAAVLLAAVCFHQWKQNGDLKRQIASLRESVQERGQREEADQKRLKKLERQSAELNRQVQTLTGELQGVRPAPAATPDDSSAGPQPPVPDAGKSKGFFGDFLSKMMDDPDMKKMMRQQQGAMMDIMYGGLFKELGLTQEETDKFKELLLDRQMKAVEAGGAFMKLQSEDNDKTAAMSELAEQQKEFDEQVKAFLGDARYTQYKDYNETMTERMTLNQFSEQMAGGRNPLNADQTSQLLEIMKQERKGMTPVFSETTVDGSATVANFQVMMSEDKMNELFKQQEEINQRVLERAKTVLTPEQLDALAAHQSSQLQMQRMGMSMAAKMFGTQKSDNPPPAGPGVR